MQKSMEDIAFLLRIPQRKPWASMSADVNAVLAQLDTNRQGLLQGVPEGREADGEKLLDDLYAVTKKLQLSVNSQQPDSVSVRLAAVLKTISELELLQVRQCSALEVSKRPHSCFASWSHAQVSHSMALLLCQK